MTTPKRPGTKEIPYEDVLLKGTTISAALGANVSGFNPKTIIDLFNRKWFCSPEHRHYLVSVLSNLDEKAEIAELLRPAEVPDAPKTLKENQGAPPAGWSILPQISVKDITPGDYVYYIPPGQNTEVQNPSLLWARITDVNVCADEDFVEINLHGLRTPLRIKGINTPFRIMRSKSKLTTARRN